MDFLVEQTSEKVEMMGWMSAGRAANTRLLRERERMPRKMAPLPRWTQAAAWSLVMWIVELPEEVNAQDGLLHITVMKSNLH